MGGRDAEGVEEGRCGRGVPLPRNVLEFHPSKDDILKHFYTLFNSVGLIYRA